MFINYINPMDLTDDEIDVICSGYKQNAAKCRYLQSLGITVRRKPNGRPLVNRQHYNSVRICDSTNASPSSSNFNPTEPVWGVH